LLTALADFDATGCYSARQAADWITRLEIVQSPGVAAVQVMTIHKSKGLGFDVVLLPHVPDDITPATQKFDVARGDRWISETPPGWVRNIMPEMRDAEQRWAASQRYEAICMLYVALTRAKRGLYVILKKPGKNSNPDKSSLANWIIRSAGQNPRSEEIIFESGSSDWVQLVDQLPVAEAQPACTQLTPPTQKLTSLTPSTAKNKNKASTHSPTGMKFGSEVHCLMEQIGWIDETPAQLPPSDAGKAVARLIKSPAVAMLFKRENKSIDLYREQATDAFMDGQLMSGIIDRLHIHRESAGSVTRVEIIDYKTDAVASSRDLVDRYSGQMQAYQLTLQKIYPNAEVVPILISVKHAELIYL
jgi:ATP-dependent exoDNAse (exonuclease V) beta subunit